MSSSGSPAAFRSSSARTTRTAMPSGRCDSARGLTRSRTSTHSTFRPANSPSSNVTRPNRLRKKPQRLMSARKPLSFPGHLTIFVPRGEITFSPLSNCLQTGQRHASRGGGSKSERRQRLLVPHLENLILPHATRRLHLDLVPGGPADERSRDGRADRDLAFLDVGFVVPDDLVGHRLAALHLLEIDGGAEHAPPVRVDPRRVDDLCVGKLALDFFDPGFDKTLALFGGVVFGVLRKIAVSPRFGDRRNRVRPFHRFQAVQLPSQQLGPGRGQWNRAHGRIKKKPPRRPKSARLRHRLFRTEKFAEGDLM